MPNQDNSHLLDDNELTVPRGFLIALDEYGNYVPFLVKVRDKDIIYTNAESSNLFKDIINKFENVGIVLNYKYNTPEKELVIKRYGWTYKIKPDGSVKATYNRLMQSSDWECTYEHKRVAKYIQATSQYTIVNSTAEFMASATFSIDLPLPISVDDIFMQGTLDIAADNTLSQLSVVKTFELCKKYNQYVDAYDNIKLSCFDIYDRLTKDLFKTVSATSLYEIMGTEETWSEKAANNTLPLYALCSGDNRHRVSICIEGSVMI